MKTIKPISQKQITPDPDVPVVSAFEGLSSSTLNQTIDPIWLDKLINAYVDENKEIRKRPGSKLSVLVSDISPNIVFELYRFSFDKENYLLIRNGTTLALSCRESTGIYRTFVYKLQALRQASANEPATYDLINDGAACHILIATPSTPLISFCLIKRKGMVQTISNQNSTITFTIEGWPTNNSTFNDSNCCIWSPTSLVHRASFISQTNSTITFSSTSPFSWAQVGNTVKFHAFFWLRFADASYYPGSFLSSSVVRKNSVPLDVNVQVPEDLVDNPIINEPQTQSTSIQTLTLFKDNPANASASVFTWKQDNLPTTPDEWAFSDGSYIVAPNQLTRPSTAFVAFGGLQPGNTPTTFLICRLRSILLGNGQGTDIGEILSFTNKSPTTNPTYYNSSATIISSGKASFFSTTNYSPSLPGFLNPGVEQDAFIELILSTTFSPTCSTNVIDLEPSSNGSISIGDGFIVPLYGYNYVADTLNHSYPSIVKVVGNRILLCGRDNTVVFSNSDWNYRGVSFNNIQISTFGFSPASAFSIKLDATSTFALASINGVVFVASNKGVFIVKGGSSSTPPNASSAFVSQVSSEIVTKHSCVTAWENKLFFASRSGIFLVIYNDNINDYEAIKLSEHVSDKFSNSPSFIGFSPTLRSLIVSFFEPPTTKTLLALQIDTSTFYTIKLAANTSPFLNSSFDGFFVLCSTSPPSSTLVSLVCEWDKDKNYDFVGLSNFQNYIDVEITGNSLVVGPTPTDCSSLTIPAELISLFSPKLKQAWGPNHAQTTDGSSLSVQEFAGGMVDFPIFSSLVTKAFTGSRLDHSHYTRAFNLLIRGQGSIVSRVVLAGQAYDDRIDETIVSYVGTVDNVTLSHFLGEGLLNAAFAHHLPTGATSNIRLKSSGSSEAWQLALLFDSPSPKNFTVAGIKFDTTAKRRRSRH
jgi:hypothetical protein